MTISLPQVLSLQLDKRCLKAITSTYVSRMSPVPCIQQMPKIPQGLLCKTIELDINFLYAAIQEALQTLSDV